MVKCASNSRKLFFAIVRVYDFSSAKENVLSIQSECAYWPQVFLLVMGHEMDAIITQWLTDCTHNRTRNKLNAMKANFRCRW